MNPRKEFSVSNSIGGRGSDLSENANRSTGNSGGLPSIDDELSLGERGVAVVSSKANR